MANLQLVVHAEQVPRLTTTEGVPLREDVAYSDHRGADKKGVRKEVTKNLAKLQAALAKVLEPEETVLYAARALAPMGWFEQFAFGWYSVYAAATTLVFTDRRMLHFLVNRKGEWRQSLRAVRWGDVESGEAKGWLGGTLELKYRNGRKEKYWQLKRREVRKLQVLVAKLLETGAGAGSTAQEMQSLCPECHAALIPRQYQCQKCGLVFKDEKTMIKRSLLIPGGGYFYTGQTFLGVMDFMAEAYLLVLLLLFVVLTFAGDQTPPEPGEEALTTAEALATTVVVAVILGVEKLFTIHHGMRSIREFIPTGRKEPVMPKAL